MKFTLPTFNRPLRAVGYPATDVVRAKQLKSGAVFIKNGSNLFQLQALASFTNLCVRPGDAGTFRLVGAEGESEKVLATFGSQAAADNALDQLARVHAGLGGIRYMRWLVGALAVYAALSFMTGPAGSVETVSGAAQLPAAQVERPPAYASAGPAGGAFNPNEPTLEELERNEIERLANGGEYRFKPNIAIPQVEVPALNCNPPAAK